MTHIDLFSGIGGFALAARTNGIHTVQFVEIDERCRDFLANAWPGVSIHDDIRTFDGAAHRGAWLLTAGVPCQPASRAGKQRGTKDDRWLWPETIRVLAEARPAWALFENPPGIGDVGLDGILSAMEDEGYEVQVLSIPACAVNAPHRRERYWIVAHNKGNRHQAESPEEKIYEPSSCCENMAHTKKDRSKYTRVNESEKCSERNWCSAVARTRQSDWSNFVWLSCSDGKVRRAPDDTVGVVDGLHRSILGALGNSIVPQVAAKIIAAMAAAEKEEDGP